MLMRFTPAARSPEQSRSSTLFGFVSIVISALGLTAKQVTSFGTDAGGRVYVTTAGGTLYRIDP